MNAFRARLHLAGACLLALAAPAFAQAQTQAVTPPVDTTPDEIVITGTGYKVAREALTSHVDVLTRTQIAEKPAAGLGDALAYLPGIRSSSFSPGASRPMIRGLDGFRVLVLNNGMGMVDVSALSPDHAIPTSPTEARRIEVLRGPSALAYGGNAIGGVVDIIDDRISSEPGDHPVDGTVTVQGSSVDSGLQGAFNVKAGRGPWVVTADAFRLKADDYAVPVAPELGSSDTATRQHNSAQDMRNMGVGLSYIAAKGFAGVSYKQTDYLYGTAVDPDVRIDLHQKRWDARGSLDLGGPAFTRLDVAAGYSDYHHAELEGEDLGTQFFSKGSEGRVALVREGQGSLSGTVGVSGFARDFRAVGDESFVPSTRTTQQGLFSQYRYDAGAWGLEGGARFDHTHVVSAESGFDRGFSTTSASLGVFWKPAEHGFLSASLTRSGRAPTDVELLADGPHDATGQFIVGNPAFRVEVGTSAELAGHLNVDNDRRLSLDAHLYASHFDNFIDLRPTGAVEDGLPVFSYIQTDADLTGAELEVSTHLATLASQALTLHAAWDITRGATATGPVARIPPQALTLKLESKGGLWDSYAEVRAVADRDGRLAAFETPTDGYVTVNLFMSRKLDGHPGLTLFAEVRNLGDVEMREATSATKDLVVGPGRNIRAGLVWNF